MCTEVSVGAVLTLGVIHHVFELFAVNAQHNFAEQLHKAAICVSSKPWIAGLICQTFEGFSIQTKIQHRVHHAGHGFTRAGTNRHKQRIACIAELLAGLCFDIFQCFACLVPQPFRHFLAEFIVGITGFGGNGESWRDGNAGAGHFAHSSTLATKQFTHGGISLGEEVYPLLCHGKSSSTVQTTYFDVRSRNGAAYASLQADISTRIWHRNTAPSVRQLADSCKLTDTVR